MNTQIRQVALQPLERCADKFYTKFVKTLNTYIFIDGITAALPKPFLKCYEAASSVLLVLLWAQDSWHSLCRLPGHRGTWWKVGRPPFPPLPRWKQRLKTPFLVRWRMGRGCPLQNPFSSRTLFSANSLSLYQRKTPTCDFSITFFLQRGAFHAYFFLPFDEWVNWYSERLTVSTKICQVPSHRQSWTSSTRCPSNRYSFPEASLQPPPGTILLITSFLCKQSRSPHQHRLDGDAWWWKDAKLLWWPLLLFLSSHTFLCAFYYVKFSTYNRGQDPRCLLCSSCHFMHSWSRLTCPLPTSVLSWSYFHNLSFYLWMF